MQTARRVRGVAGFDQRGPTSDPRWQAALNRIAPRTRYGHDWLLLRWEPGDPWDPVERWFIYQMTPWWRIPHFGVLDALRGPNPRNYGYYDEHAGRFIRTKLLPISRQQWEIFQEYGCWAQPFWIIQGRRGGHLRRFTDIQSTIAQMNGAPPEPPRPGDLPYAPFDRRVVEKIKRLDLVQRFGDTLGNLADRPWLVNNLDRRETALVHEMGRELWEWLGSQVEQELNPGTGDGLGRAQIEAIREHADPDAKEPDYEQIEENFLDTVGHSYTGS